MMMKGKELFKRKGSDDYRMDVGKLEGEKEEILR